MANNELLTELIKEERLKHEPPERWRDRARKFCSDLWLRILYPNVWLALSIGFLIPFLSVLQGLIGLNFSTGFTDNDLQGLFSTLWEIQATIVGILLPLLLLIIEFAKDDEYPTARISDVFLQKTPVVLITSMAFGSLFKTSIDTFWYVNGVTLYIDFIIFLMATFGTFYAYTKVTKLMVNLAYMRREAEQLHLEKVMSTRMDTSIDGRIGNNILFVKLEELHLEYMFFKPGREEASDHVILSLNGEGRLGDINFQRLKNFLNKLPRNTTTTNQESSGDVYLLKKFKDPIGPDDRDVILLKKAAFCDLKRTDLEEELKNIFSITEDTQIESPLLRDSLIRAVRDGQTDVLERGLNTYFQLAKIFLEKLKPFKEPYTQARVLEESRGLGEGWAEIEWIRVDYREILDEAFLNERENIIRKLLHFPFELASIGLEKGDYYLFHNFTLGLPGYGYRLSRRLTDNELRSTLIDCCWRFPKEFSDLYIGHFLDQPQTKLSTIEDFSLGLILAFKNLLKNSFDHRDLSGFKTFSKGFLKCFEFSRIRLERFQEAGNNGSDLKDSRNSGSDLVNKIDMRRKQLMFGLEAWALYQFQAQKLGVSETKEWRDIFSKWHSDFRNIHQRDPFKVLEDCLQTETEDFFNWDWWSFDETEDSHAPNLDNCLIQLYCLEIIKELKSLNHRTQNWKRLPKDNGNAERIQNTAKNMVRKPDIWQPLTGAYGLLLLEQWTQTDPASSDESN